MENKKKKVLIWMTSMHPGGVERALIGLLSTFDYSKYSVELFLNRHEGAFLPQIPKEVKLLPSNPKYESLAEPIQQTFQRGQTGIALCRILAKMAAYLKERGKNKDGGITVDYSHRFTKWLMPKINSDTIYDLAISFITPHYFVADKVNAIRKVAWIHTDYSQISIDLRSQHEMWSAYDRIIAVSESVAESYVHVFPQYKDRVEVIENILPQTIIWKQAKETVIEYKKGEHFKLLSVGRFSYPKNFDSIPVICRLLKEKGIKVKWYIIGYGGDEQKIKDAIILNGVEEDVIMIGKKSNPYPYILGCDVYVQPSRYEGKAVTVREAQILGKPVVITNFPTSQSQVVDGYDGIIVPLNNEECASEIAKLLANRRLMQVLSDNCLSSDYSAKNEIEKIYRLIES